MRDIETWLARRTEEALDPELPICDPHHHLWDHPGSRYLLEEFARDRGTGHRVVKTVYVECVYGYRSDGPAHLRPVGEVETIERLMRTAPTGPTAVAAGIVGFADLTLGGRAREVLEAELAASPRFRGIRHASARSSHAEIRSSHTNPPEGLLGQSDFREGFACLEPLGLSFDAWLYFTQIDELADLARSFPQTTIILNHVGGPLGIGPYAGKRAEVYASWQRSIAGLARCPNVVVKLGAVTATRTGFGWHRQEIPPSSADLARDTGPYYDYCIQQFGPERCMFESNFPVDKASCSYTVLWNSFKRIASGYSDKERRALFHDTAVRAYRLTDAASDPHGRLR